MLFIRHRAVLRKACGRPAVGLPYWLFKTVLLPPAAILEHISNLLLSVGRHPSTWNHDLITPVPKNNPPQSASDLQPISVTILSRLLERYIVYTYLPPTIGTSAIRDQIALRPTAAPLQRLFSLNTMSPDYLRLTIA